MPRRLVLALVVALVSIASVTTAAAQVPTPTPARSQPKVDRAQAFVDALAARLGKTSDELRSAFVAAQKDLVAKAQHEGRITAEQAAKMNQRIELGRGVGALSKPAVAPPKPARQRAHVAQVSRLKLAELAGFLGVTQQQLGQELRAGKSIAEVGAAHGKSRDQILGYVAQRVDKAVADGRLTPEQAARAKERIGAAIDLKRPAKPDRPARRGA